MGVYKAIVAENTVDMYGFRLRKDILLRGVLNSQHPISFTGQELL